jgi:hypothetical protein
MIDKTEFILPERWAVKITEENRNILYNWAKSQPKYSDYWNEHWTRARYCLSKHFNDNSYCYCATFFFVKHPEYIEITFDEFQKYVLKKIEPLIHII